MTDEARLVRLEAKIDLVSTQVAEMRGMLREQRRWQAFVAGAVATVISTVVAIWGNRK